MTISHRIIASVVASLAIFTTSVAHAGEVTGVTWFSGVASLAGTAFDPPVAPGNDNHIGDSPNEIWVTQKDYFAIGPVDLVFDVSDNAGTTEYRVREGVYNGTGLLWDGYHIELGFGEGAGFVKSAPGDGLDFDSPDFDSPVDFNPGPGFSTVDVFEDDIIASDGFMPHGSFAGYFIFHIDVPNGISSFTIRQSPIEHTAAVPEPSTYAMGMLALCGLGVVVWRRRVGSAV